MWKGLVNIFSLVVLIFVIILALSVSIAKSEERLMIFAGAASKLPTEEASKQFEKKTGIKVDLMFGGSGYVLTQMMLSKEGDIYFPGSSDFMEP